MPTYDRLLPSVICNNNNNNNNIEVHAREATVLLEQVFPFIRILGRTMKPKDKIVMLRVVVVVMIIGERLREKNNIKIVAHTRIMFGLRTD